MRLGGGLPIVNQSSGLPPITVPPNPLRLPKVPERKFSMVVRKRPVGFIGRPETAL